MDTELIQSEQDRTYDAKEEKKKINRGKKRKVIFILTPAHKNHRLVREDRPISANKSLRCSVKGGYKGNRRGHFLEMQEVGSSF